MIYVASPLGFAESTLCFLDALKSQLTELGYDFFDPWSQGYDRLIEDAIRTDNGGSAHSKLKQVNHRISKKNETAIRSCEQVVAVLDGVDVDSGTASEIGFAYAIGKRVSGLRTDFRKSGDNDAAIVNIQVQYWIEASGGRIYRSLAELSRHLSKKSAPMGASRR